MGGLRGHEFFKLRFTANQHQITTNIAQKELWGIVVACQVWGSEFKGQQIFVECDNIAVVQVINTGCARDGLLQKLMRELLFIAARDQFKIHAKHIPGWKKVIPDLFSWWWIEPKVHKQFEELTKEHEFCEVVITEKMFQLVSNW